MVGGPIAMGHLCRNGGSMKCWICGKRATRTLVIKKFGDEYEEVKPSKMYRCYCEECRNAVEKQEKEERERIATDNVKVLRHAVQYALRRS